MRARLMLVLLLAGCSSNGGAKDVDAPCAEDEFRPVAPYDQCAPKCASDVDCGGGTTCQRATDDDSVRVCWDESDALPTACPYGCLQCVGIESAETCLDPASCSVDELERAVVGTWVPLGYTDDGELPVIELRADGTHREIITYSRPRENGPGDVRTSTWTLEATTLVINDLRRYELQTISATGMHFVVDEFAEFVYEPGFARANCTGFGFEENEYTPEVRCDDATDCAHVLGEPGSCDRAGGKWGSVAVCAPDRE